MRIVTFAELTIPQIAEVMAHGRPWLPDASDYWFFKQFHGTTSFAASIDEALVGGIIACVDGNKPPRLYIDQVAVHSSFRGKGIVQRLFRAAEEKATELGCISVWLSTDPRNPAVRVWPRLGYENCPGDRNDGVLGLHSNFKGPGKDRALFQKALRP
jgi:ribosomal protein S18 acetylase RimI-like enzyme